MEPLIRVYGVNISSGISLYTFSSRLCITRVTTPCHITRPIASRVLLLPLFNYWFEPLGDVSNAIATN